MDYEKEIKHLADTTDLDNYAISMRVGCSPRTTRRYAGSFSKRHREKIGPRSTARILLFDIETAPMEVYVWGLHDKRNQYISYNNVIKGRSVLSWAARWLFESEVMSEVATTSEARNRKDKRVLYEMWQLLEEADIIIAHNAQQFDVRRLNARFILNDYGPPMPYRVIDTLTEARKTFDFESNKLDDLNEQFGLSKKLPTDFDLWKRCVTGDASALEEMVTYNRSDVIALEELYLVLRPWIKGCLLYTSPSPRDRQKSRMPSSA